MFFPAKYLISGYLGDFVKLFPAGQLSPEYVKAVKTPLAHIPLIAMGGIGLSSFSAYAKAGVSAFGIGSGIVDKTAIANGDFSKITQLAKTYVEEIEKAFQ